MISNLIIVHNNSSELSYLISYLNKRIDVTETSFHSRSNDGILHERNLHVMKYCYLSLKYCRF